ncbi:phosphatidylserine decarboxylase-domain-containing protein [Aspergillus spinulosporus]
MGIIGLVHAAIQNRQVGWLNIESKTRKYMRKQQPLWKKLKLLLLFNPLRTWLDTTHAMRLYMHNSAIKEGKKEATPASAKRIREFISFFHINMDEFEPSDPAAFSSFEEFFVRHHKPRTWPIFEAENPSSAVCVAGLRVVVYEHDFTITNLVMDRKLGPQFGDGPVTSFRLSPQDYHRYHSPVSGKIKVFRGLPGDYYEVDLLAIRSGVDNARDSVVIETEELGEVLFVAIGAGQVGTVEYPSIYTLLVQDADDGRIHEKWQKPGAEIMKGDELGIFQFGGSSIIVAFQKGRIQSDEDLVEPSKRAIAVDVEVGMSLGRATSEAT